MRTSVVTLVLVALATPAAAQSTYLGAALIVDVARYDRTAVEQPTFTLDMPSTDGEALGLGVQIGRAIGDRWGVEFEFARAGEIENGHSRVVAAATQFAALPAPDFAYDIETRHRTTSYGALAWVRQGLGERVDLTFLGGVVFTRVEVEQRLDVTDDRLAQWISVVPTISGIEHATAPAVGLQAAFKLNASAAVTMGLRLQGASVMDRGGWLLRPSTGIRWTF